MKKILLLAVLLLPCVPSLVAGIQSQCNHNRDQKLEMLEPRFRAWCLSNNIAYYDLITRQLDAVWMDLWQETDDFINAVDSVDSVLNVSNNILNNP